MGRMMPVVPAAIEHAPAPIYFSNGLHRCDHIGNGNLMFTYYINEWACDGHGQFVRVIEMKLVMHANDVMQARAITTPVLAEHVPVAPGMVM